MSLASYYYRLDASIAPSSRLLNRQIKNSYENEKGNTGEKEYKARSKNDDNDHEDDADDDIDKSHNGNRERNGGKIARN